MKAPRVPVHERVRACFALTLSMKQLFPYCKILEDTFMDLANNGEYPALYAALPMQGVYSTFMDGARICMAPRSTFFQPAINFMCVSGPSGLFTLSFSLSWAAPTRLLNIGLMIMTTVIGSGKTTAQNDLAKETHAAQRTLGKNMNANEISGPALMQMMQYVATHHDKKQEEEASDKESEAPEAQEKLQTMALADQIHAGSVLYMVDEIAAMFQKLKEKGQEQDRCRLLTMWNDGPISKTNVGKGRSAFIQHPQLNIVGWTQADVICGILDKELQESTNDGFIGRLSLCNPEPSFRAFYDHTGPRSDGVVQLRTVLKSKKLTSF